MTFNSSDSNYLSTSITSSITIQPATPSVGILNGQWEFTYDGTPQSVIGSAVGIDGLTPINGTFTYEYYNEYGSNTILFGPPLPGAPTDAGSYTFIEYFTSQDPNYAAGTYSWNLQIDPAQSTVNVSGGPYTYDGSSQGATVAAVGVGGVTPVTGATTVTYNGSSTVPSVAGTYTVQAAFASSDPNYYGGSADGTLVITKATPSFSNLSSPSVNLGAATVTVSGHLAAGSAAPSGDAVSITLNGTTQSVSIGSSGNFSTSFNIQGLGTGSYPIIYEFLGDATRFNAAGTGFAGGTLTVQAAPSILTNPVSQTVVSGAAVTFSASASGYPVPTVQWQMSTSGNNYSNISGATNSTFTISAATASQNGYHYRAVFSNSVGSATTGSATLTVQTPPTVTTNPSSPTVNAGQTATFAAAASGNPTPTVQWQVSTDGGNTFSNVSGAANTTLSLSATTASENGYVYHAVFTNSVGSVTTANATLTVRFAPTVTLNAVSQSVTTGQTATFTVAAAGNPTPTVQWQLSTNGGSSYSNIAGATSTTLTLTNTTLSQNGYKYRAAFTNSLGSATTTAGTLTVQTPLTITTSPSNTTVNAGQTATFTAAASGSPTPTVQWQVSTDGGNTFSNIAGATSTTLTISATTASENGYVYHAVFTNSVGFATTANATLTVSFAPAITSANNVTYTAGTGGTFAVTATGSPIDTLAETAALPSGVSFADNGNNTGSLVVSSSAAAGTYNLAIAATNGVGSPATQSFTLTVSPASTTVNLSLVDVNSDAANAAIYDGGTQRSMVNSVVYHFATPVNLDPSAITIMLHSGVTMTLGNGTQTTGTIGTVPDGTTWASPDGGYTWVVTFAGAGVTGGGSIADGVYDIILNATHITTASGGAVSLNAYDGGNGGTGNDTETFWCLYGDANANRKVTTQDYAAFAPSYLAHSNNAAYVAWFDRNGDAKVTTADYAAFASNYLKKYSGFTATI